MMRNQLQEYPIDKSSTFPVNYIEFTYSYVIESNLAALNHHTSHLNFTLESDAY